MGDNTITVIDTAIQACDAYGREDLAERLTATKERMTDPTIRVMVVGEFKQGKSSLVNAMLNAPVCPVDDDVATSVPTVIRYAEQPHAGVVRADGDRPDGGHAGASARAPGSNLEPGGEVIEAIEFDALPVYASEFGNPGNERGLLAVEIGLPRTLLANGIALIDTPGVGGLGSAHTAATIAALPTADVVLFVSDSSQEITRPEYEFLQAAQEVCDTCAFVMTKTDFYPEWRRIRELNEAHLSSLRTEVPIFTASATLRGKAIESNDKSLNIESGYPALIEFLQTTAAGVAEQVTAGVVSDLRSVVVQLTGGFDIEKKILEDPRRAAAVMAEFERAKERTESLRNQAARWQLTLNDGIADLTADFDHRLRGRLRQTTSEADLALDEQEPGDIWDEFSAWLRRRVSYDLAQTYLELARRTQQLSQEVAEHFDDGEAALQIQLDPNGVLSTAASIDPRTEIEQIKVGAGAKAMTAMRGSYGGLLMFGMVAQMAGMAMLNPATAVIGAMMGRKAVKDEKERQLAVQRQQAKITARQFIDDAGFEVAKEMKDAMRKLHRQLRDHYQDRAEELNRSIATALATAKDALNTSQRKRESRLRDVEAELGRLAGLSTQVDALLPKKTTASPTGAESGTGANRG